MFKKVLVANRGEIAVRVIRSCRDLGVPTVAVYSDPDRNSMHVLLADEAVAIGGSTTAESYLDMNKIMMAIKTSGADAVHPGYGFLSENAKFAELLESNGITFIGPTSKNISAMGDKIRAKEIMREAGVPVVPGSNGALSSVEEAKTLVKDIGLPIIIKAAAGGGGRGMRVVFDEKDLESSIRAAKSEGKNYFGNDTIYIERFITSPKHIEIQVFGDKHGNAVHLFDRECSCQRRHQKIIEEAPSPSVPEKVRLEMGAVAVKASKAIGYVGAGTFEFIFDDATKEYFFMEMNTRLQVEHPVTEMITGLNLVEEQLRVAAGHKLSFEQDSIRRNGHAIEVRVCAEDPVVYTPSPGKIRVYRPPQGPDTRVDSCAYPGYEIPIFYDPMIAKVITWGPTRDDAIKRMKRALTEFMLTGVKTNIVLHKSILKHPKFLDGSYTTQFVEKEVDVTEPALFKFVDDDVFLISAAISTHNLAKSKDTRRIQVASQWKSTGRRLQLRT